MADRIAIFFDVENLWIAARGNGLEFNVPAIVKRIREEGIIACARAYGEWSKPWRDTDRVQAEWGKVRRDFDLHGFELTELASLRGKNTADVQIAVDALEIALTSDTLNTVVLVSGDRDFVPLVHKLKRYGKWVIGIGISGATSKVLQAVCDSYISYDELLPATSVPDELRSPEVDKTAVFLLMLRAVDAIQRRGNQALGSTTSHMMKQMDSTFDVQRFGVTFKGLAREAQEKSYVILHDRDGSDFWLEPAPEALRNLRSKEASLDLQFESTEEALHSYENLLSRKRVLLIPWIQREPLVRHLWTQINLSLHGLTSAEMLDALRLFAHQNDFDIAEDALRKLTSTLRIGRCFSEVGAASPNWTDQDWTHGRFQTSVEIVEALDQMQRFYVNGLVLTEPNVPLIPEPLALLLFDELNNETLQRTQRIIEAAEVTRRRSRPPEANVPPPLLSLTPEEAEPDYLLLRQVVLDLQAKGRKTTGSSVKAALLASSSGFDLSRHGGSFKRFVERAAEARKVRIAGPAGGDFLIEPVGPK